MKKNIFPILFVALVFGTTMVAQMVINGKNLNASKLSKSSEKYLLFEKNFETLKVTTTKKSKIELKKAKKPIVILNFWASWCLPCKVEFKSLTKLVNKYPNDILVIGINNDDEKPELAISKTEKELSLNFESTVDKDNEITNLFEIERIPGTITFHNGKVIHFSNEEHDFMGSEYLALLDKKLSE